MNQLKAGAVLSYVSLALSNILALIYTPFMLRMLGKEEYGLLALGASVISYLGLLTFGFGAAITRYAVRYKTHGQKEQEHSLYGLFVLLYLVLGLIALIAGLALCFYADYFFQNTMSAAQISRLRLILLLMTLNTALSFPLGVFGGIVYTYERFVFSRVVGIAAALVSPLLTVGLLLSGFKAVAIVVVGFAINIVTSLIHLWYVLVRLKVKVRFQQLDWGLLREIAGFSFYVFLAMIVDQIYWSTGQFVLGAVAGASVVAVYAVGMTFRMYFFNFSTAISGVFFPKVTEMITRNCSNEQMSELFIRVGRIQFLVIFFILNGFILFGQEFIGYWAGPGYEQSYWVAVIVMVPVSVPLIQNLGITILQARNQQRFRSVLYVVMALASLGLTIPMAQRYGAIGCVWGAAIALILGNILVMNIYYHKRIGLNIPAFWRSIGRCGLPLLPVIALAWVGDRHLATQGVILLSAKMMIFSIVYLGVLWRWSMNDYERNLFYAPFARMFRFK